MYAFPALKSRDSDFSSAGKYDFDGYLCSLIEIEDRLAFTTTKKLPTCVLINN